MLFSIIDDFVSYWQIKLLTAEDVQNLQNNINVLGFVCVEVLRPSQPKWGHVERGQFT